MNISIADTCIRCGRCVQVCPSLVFERAETGGCVVAARPEACIRCGHCVAACSAGAVRHEAFPPERIHAADYAALPRPEALERLLATRRSMRVFRREPIPEEALDRIVAAADRAPTASNARALGYVVVTDPARLRAVIEFTLATFDPLVRLLSNPLVRPWLQPLLPGVYRYVRVFRRMRREWDEQGIDRILRGATALVAIHAPKSSRFGSEDANLAYQNASLMAEASGVGQLYAGFVLTAVRRRKGVLERQLGLAPDRRIRALMALGLPQFRYPHTFDREPAPVTRM